MGECGSAGCCHQERSQRPQASDTTEAEVQALYQVNSGFQMIASDQTLVHARGRAGRGFTGLPHSPGKHLVPDFHRVDTPPFMSSLFCGTASSSFLLSTGQGTRVGAKQPTGTGPGSGSASLLRANPPLLRELNFRNVAQAVVD